MQPKTTEKHSYYKTELREFQACIQPLTLSVFV